VPQSAHKTRTVASIECLEDIACNLCEKSCPESAIQIVRSREPDARRFLIEADCTACGACLAVCPSQVPVLIREQDDRSFSKLTLGWKGQHAWKVGEFATLLNRRGEPMGQARVSKIPEFPEAEGGRDLEHFHWVELDVPTHLLWESRGIRPAVPAEKPDVEMQNDLAPAEKEARVFITLNGEKRLVRDGLTIGVALFEMAQNRTEDSLYCPDGSCQLCTVFVDGVKKLACQTRVRKGMGIVIPESSPEFASESAAKTSPDEIPLCPCEGISCQQVVDRLKQGQLSSVEAVLSAVPVGSGKCHGQMCSRAFERILTQQGLDPENWIDWRFPWIDWVVMPGGS
jgi:ferredoxin